MTETGTCSNCGARLPADAPEGLCPSCLFKRALETNTAACSGGKPQPARWAPLKAAELQAIFPELDVLELIGRGGMGAVYKARQKSLDRLVALKILPPEIGYDPAFSGRFGREARAMARLTHPNIVAIHDFGQRGEVFFFLMEYVDGLSLRQLMDAGKLEPKEALAIVPRICDALQYAHDRGIVHRDIKPENILLGRQGQVKIADFGLAKLMERAGTGTTTVPEAVMGTPQYMAPEQVEKPRDVDHRADIYSLGVVLTGFVSTTEDRCTR
jgi:serine/threonine protein kinase